MSVHRIPDEHFHSLRDTLQERTLRPPTMGGVTPQAILRSLLSCEKYVFDAALQAETLPYVGLSSAEIVDQILDQRGPVSECEDALQRLLSVFVGDCRRLNRLAWAARYDETYSGPGALPKRELAERLSDIGLYKALRHVEHNSAEAEWHGSYDTAAGGRLPNARAVLSELLSEIARRIVESSPSYDEADPRKEVA